MPDGRDADAVGTVKRRFQRPPDGYVTGPEPGNVNRRRFLAVAGLSATAATTAGCSTVGGRTELGVDEERLDDEGSERHLYFRDGDERVAVLSLDQMNAQAEPTDSFRFRLHIQHGSGAGGPERESVVERFRFDLRAPPASVNPPAEIYLQAPGGGRWPDFTFEEVEDLWTRIEADDTREVGSGTMTLSLLVDPVGVPADEVGVRASVDLAEQGFGGSSYRLEATTRFEPVVESA
ncbi:hypothetical protein BRC67_07575 [Halobacteriales archaeon QH_3_68_24]|nr:MAG: hypothetical protein BRC67_07575 [Halobacteriales archaeon QH_3_68_24]